jgi:hypothetical protein
MESLMGQLTDEELVKHLSPVEQRLYRSSDRLEQLNILCNSRWVNTICLIVEKTAELGHPTDIILGG